MGKDYGICWVDNIQKPFVGFRVVKKGKNEGKVEVYLTKGRWNGEPIKGKKVYVEKDMIVSLPDDLVFVAKGE